MDMYDVVIIGSGLAGYTAALYNSRAFLKTLLITGPEPGGQLTTTTEVENYPGFVHGVMGPELMEIIKKQVVRFGTEIKQEQVIKVKIQNAKVKSESQKSKVINTFNVKSETSEYEARSVIIATGASAKYLGLESEQRLRGKGVSACATCDGFFFKDKKVVVIGGGDTAMEEATFLSRFATKVTIIHRREEFRASPIMLKRAQDNPKIRFLTNKTVLEVVGQDKVTGARITDINTGQEEVIDAQGFFLAIGHTPNTDFLKGFVELDEKHYIKLKTQNSKLKAQTETSVPGVFAAGDCVDPRYRQAVVAAGIGCMAALDAQKWLEES
ncbi:thioredoxin-disulfide reductase [Candidatus Gottesmanbacteria bacterium RBG_16_43_7]|uniref:Thioredoxin reductase n=1 Tax=Candidatus Gottesmanbacteria bacterium RBG_16_43_7 TaxID=1798373 RepID=A0A1F5ZC10_9BACT|nr:MAG: thioredoxin-disulfide reductase [Candidatus Gottesmanbacteria bacterium RBG_16_43_7]